MKKPPTKKISLIDFGMSDAYAWNGKRPPFFIRVDGQIYQNPECQILGRDFMNEYTKFLSQK